MMRKPFLVALVLLPFAAVALAYPVQQPNGVALTTELQALGDKKKEVRLKAVQRLGSWGAAAALAAPELGKRVQEDSEAEVANQAALALAKIGPAGARELMKAAQSPQPTVRQRALWALAKMGPAAKEALGVLRDTLQDPNPSFRALAALALGEMGANAVPAVGDLCRALRDPIAEVRKQAACALANLGSDAVPDLQKQLHEEDALLRLTAVEALALQGADAEDAVPDLAKLLKDEEPALRFAAATALAAVGPAAKEAVPQLLEAIKDNRVEVQQAAFQALMHVNADDVPGLLDAFRKLNQEHHWAAPYVLKQFGPNTKDAVKPLIQRLEAKDEGERLAAVLALCHIGPQAKEALPALQKALKDPSPQVQYSAAFALRLIQAGAPADNALSLPNAIKAFAQDLELQKEINKQQHDIDSLLRPVNRQALFNPQVQERYNKIVYLHVMLSVRFTHLCKCMLEGPQKEISPDEQALLNQVRDVVNNLEAEAVPALLRGMYLTAYYDLGFT
jgi:HEAT repeat protein